jgi:hypothetical protein
LEGDEDDGGEDSPLAQRVFEEALVHIQADEELVGGSVRRDEPDAITDDERGDATRDDPAVSEDQLVPLVMVDGLLD